jgi:hypothetical protein
MLVREIPNLVTLIQEFSVLLLDHLVPRLFILRRTVKAAKLEQ